MMIRFCCILFIAFGTPLWAEISGQIDVVDGDTLNIGAQSIRLHGIDAPEIDQLCDDREGQPWPCGVFVRDAVIELFQGLDATCNVLDQDRYGRSIAKCYVNGADIAEEIVRRGWAEAYRRYSFDYDLAEKTAQLQGVGLWSGTMQSPSAFRADQRMAVPGAQPPDPVCFIKGNISASGRIYHLPQNRDYEATRINEAEGERWFCTEAEARAAGWRPARN